MTHVSQDRASEVENRDNTPSSRLSSCEAFKPNFSMKKGLDRFVVCQGDGLWGVWVFDVELVKQLL